MYKTIILLLCILASELPAQKLFLTDGVLGSVQNVNIDGSGSVTNYAISQGSLGGIDVDLQNGLVYWCTISTPAIKRANIDGSAQITLISEAAGSLILPRGIAIDNTANKIFWTDNGNGTLMSANLNGTGVVQLLTGLTAPGAVAVDKINGYIYWADNGVGSKKIRRCLYNGTGATDVVTGLDQIWGFALDVPGGEIYWIDSGIDKMQKGALSSLPVTKVDVIASLTGYQRGMLIDKLNNRMYWSNNGTSIQRANLDGTSSTTLVSGLTHVQGIAVNSESALPVELTSFSVSSVNGKVILKWETATELNSYGFEIERSSSSDADGMWELVGFVKGSGNSNSSKQYSFDDQSFSYGKVYYRLKMIDADGTFEYSNIICLSAEVPTQFALKQNYPNPFNPSTTIGYSVPKESRVAVSVFDMLGQKVADLADRMHSPGNYSVNFDATALPSGLYICVMKIYDAEVSLSPVKMNLIK